MNQLRELAQQNPAALQQIIQQLVAGNPQLADLAAQNPEALLQMLGGGADEEGEQGAHVIQVTPEEHAAIQRVCIVVVVVTCPHSTCVE